ALLSMFEALFHWNDILVTKRALQAGFDGLLTSLSGSLKHDIPQQLKRHFAAARSTLTERFADARKQLGDKNLVAIGGEARPGQPNPFDDPRFASLSQSHGVQANYVNQFASSSLAGATLTGFEPSADELARMTSFVARLEAIFKAARLEQTAEQIGNNLAELGRDPSRFLQLGVSTMLTIIESLLQVTLAVAEQLLDVLFELLGDALARFGEALKVPLQIPVISALYQQIAGAPLSLLDLACLMLATPATIIYKALNRGAAPFAAGDVDKVRAVMARWGDLRRVIAGPSAEELV